MVVFTCINCGESVKKTAVAKHYMGRCRGPPNVTCVDCLKDFRGTDYEAHTKCVTEEERYSAKGFVAKPNSNKGEKKQQSWCEAIQSILNSDAVQGDERQLLTLLSAHENVPRKKGKFLNFLASAHRSYAKRHDLVERVWNIIEEAGKPATEQPKMDEVTSANGHPEPKPNKEKKSKNGIDDGEPNGKKRKHLEGIPQDDETNGVSEGTGKTAKKKKKEKALQDGSNEVIDSSVNESDLLATDDGDGIKTETSISLLRKLVNTAGGSSNLYKFQQSLTEYCASEFGPEKADKRLKKILKNIKVCVNGDDILLK